MGVKSKEEKLKSHSKKRFLDLYGIEITDALEKVLIERIQTHVKADHIDTQSHRISIWSITVTKTDVPSLAKKIKIPIVYDKTRKMIISALPQECLDIHNIGNHQYEWCNS